MKYSLLVLALLGLTACHPSPPTSDQVQQAQQEQLNKQATMSVGMPTIINWQERRTLKQVYEMRDQALTTYTYIVDMNGHLHKVCDSIGYGISGATQFTNPQQVIDRGNSQHYATVVLPQADPNGLYSPPTDEGTWVLCKDPGGDKVMPVRFEPNTITSPFPLSA